MQPAWLPPASATRAGRPTASRATRTPTRTSAATARSSSSTTASSRTTRPLRRELAARGHTLHKRDRHRDDRPPHRGARRRRSAACWRLCAVTAGAPRGVAGDRRHVARPSRACSPRRASATPAASWSGYGDGEMVLASDLAAVLPHHAATSPSSRTASWRVSTGSGATFIDLDGGARRGPAAARANRPRERAQGRVPALHAEGDHGAAGGARRHDLEPRDPRARRAVPRRPRRRLSRTSPAIRARRAHRHGHEPARGDARPALLRSASPGSRPRSTTPASSATATPFSARTRSSSPSASRARRWTCSKRWRSPASAGAIQVTICNTEGAQTTRVADGTVYTRAGLERGVASTKCFTTAVVALYALALGIGARERASRRGRVPRSAWPTVAQLPDGGREGAGGRAPRTRRRAATVADAGHLLFLGRGLAFPVAMEGRAQDEGDPLHPRRRLRRRGDEARPDRPHRPDIPDGRGRDEARASFEDDLEHRTGPGARRAASSRSSPKATRRWRGWRTRRTDASRKCAALLEPIVATIPLQLLGLLRRRPAGLRRRPAAQPGEDGHGRVSGRPSQTRRDRSGAGTVAGASRCMIVAAAEPSVWAMRGDRGGIGSLVSVTRSVVWFRRSARKILASSGARAPTSAS